MSRLGPLSDGVSARQDQVHQEQCRILRRDASRIVEKYLNLLDNRQLSCDSTKLKDIRMKADIHPDYNEIT
ncbi:hypothetical protein, partial [Methylocystis sp.]|uniref:hypothetical protein n=1 Tax=Methylocystis sp. TaxID=1911079 RepID=UPI003DA2C04C